MDDVVKGSALHEPTGIPVEECEPIPADAVIVVRRKEEVDALIGEPLQSKTALAKTLALFCDGERRLREKK